MKFLIWLEDGKWSLAATGAGLSHPPPVPQGKPMKFRKANPSTHPLQGRPLTSLPSFLAFLSYLRQREITLAVSRSIERRARIRRVLPTLLILAFREALPATFVAVRRSSCSDRQVPDTAL